MYGGYRGKKIAYVFPQESKSLYSKFHLKRCSGLSVKNVTQSQTKSLTNL